MRKTILFLFTTLTLFAVFLLMTLFSHTAPATAAPDEAPPDSVPVNCSASALDGETKSLRCQREDTGVVFTQVAASKSLLLTDFIIEPVVGGSSGQIHQVSILDALQFPVLAVDESLDIIGGYPDTTVINLSAFFVVDSGNYPAFKNSVSSDYSASVTAYGYLADSIIINPTAVSDVRMGLTPLEPWVQLILLGIVLGLGFFTYKMLHHPSLRR